MSMLVDLGLFVLLPAVLPFLGYGLGYRYGYQYGRRSLDESEVMPGQVWVTEGHLKVRILYAEGRDCGLGTRRFSYKDINRPAADTFTLVGPPQVIYTWQDGDAFSIAKVELDMFLRNAKLVPCASA
jgi:hypothetical protein